MKATGGLVPIRRMIRKYGVERLPESIRGYLDYIYYRYMKAEGDVIRKLCDPAKISVDVGANRGDVTELIRRFSCRVHCFEPIPELCERMRNRFRNRNVVVECCALGDGSEEGYLNVPCVNGGPHFGWGSLRKEFGEETISGRHIERVERLQVSVRRLDDFQYKNVGFIKIDVEGHELNVLRGAENTIRSDMPNLCVEIERRHHGGEDFAHVFRQILDVGYRGFFLYKGTTHGISEFDGETMQDAGNEGTDGYVSDFYFSVRDIR